MIPAGSFTIGDTLDGENDAIPTNVTVSTFHMDTNLVSYSQWQAVYTNAVSHGYSFVNAGAGQKTNQPVYGVDWFDAVKWCNARSSQAGLTPVYYTDPGLTQVYTNGEVAPSVNWAANGYRLPTEAEWEKAARGGLSGHRFPWGDTIDWHHSNYFGYPGGLPYDNATSQSYCPTGTVANANTPYTSPVGSFVPNNYGLFDMAGNLQEWCWDWSMPPPYPAGSPYLGGSDPRGPSSGGGRVLRGGHWNNIASAATCAYRNANSPDSGGDNTIGFRRVRNN